MKLLQTLLLAGAATQAFGNELLTVDKLENDVTETELRRILSSLNKIGRDNGGNRAFGLPGYNASMDYVLERAVKRFGKHMDTYVQKFTHVFEQTNRIELNEVDKEPVEAVSMRYNTPTPLPDGVTGKLVGLPVDDTRGSGCLAEQWDGIDVKGKIVLVKRGQCNIVDKVIHAKTRGAKAFILYNNVDGPAVRSSLGLDSQGRIVPSVSTTMALGNEWQKRMATGEEMEVQVVVDTLVENRDSWNIISETKEGDPNNVVMLGAHLDSVQAGPGVNDDGSGTAALLAIMGSIKKYKGFPNKVRFAWWGAEESGLIGSLYYGSKLTTEEADKIRFYYNFDMIGSPAPFYRVYADSEDHKYGGKFLFDHLVKNGKEAEYAKFGSSSDYVAFLKLGIPSSGIFTGAGIPWDPNYHTIDDDIDNIDWDAMVINSKAAARAVGELALSLEGVPPRKKTSPNPRSRKSIARAFQSWSDTVRVAEKVHTCGGQENIMI